MIVRIWSTRIVAGRDADYLAFAERRSRPMFLAQPGCLGVLFLKSRDGHAVCSFWRSQEDVDALAASPQYLATSSELKSTGVLTSEPTLVVYEVEGGELPPSPESEANKRLVRYLLEEVDKGNLCAVDQCYAADYVDHHPTPVRSLASGIDGVKKAFSMFRSAFPDTQHVIHDLIAEGDRVVVRLWAQGTHAGELMGIAPTGRTITLGGIAIYRVVDGKIVERWVEQGPGVVDQLLAPGVATDLH